MSARSVYRCLMALVFLLACAMLLPRAASAQGVICSASATSINFGSVDPSQTSSSTASGQISFTCKNETWFYRYVTACINIGAGSSASGNTLPRDMDGPAPPPLRFQLYKDAARTQVWGSVLTPATPAPLQVSFTLNANGGTWTSPNYTIHGRVPGSQSGVATGSFQNSFSGVNAAISGQTSYFGYPSDCGTQAAVPFPFVVSAQVEPTCTVTATDMNFGNAGLLDSGVHDATSAVSVKCVNGTAYRVGLDNGLHATGNTRRMQGPGGFVAYELYRNNGRSQRWGNNQGVDTVNGTGNGSTQNRTVYGRVPSQVTPSAGTYRDTITVTVTY